MVERLPYSAVWHTDGFAVFHQYRRSFNGFYRRVQYAILHIRVVPAVCPVIGFDGIKMGRVVKVVQAVGNGFDDRP